MQSRASAPTMKTMGVCIFQRRMAKQIGEKLHACSAFSRGCRHVKKDLWYSDTGRKQADTLNMRMSPLIPMRVPGDMRARAWDYSDQIVLGTGSSSSST